MQALFRFATVYQDITQHYLGKFGSAASQLSMQVFAVPLDYCKAPKPMPYKQQAAGEDAPPLVLVLLPECLLAGRRAFRSRDTSGIGPFVYEDGARHGRTTDQVVVRHRR